MGTCFSSSRKEPSTSSSPSKRNSARASRYEPPPEPEAEETVKEVLSETPNPKPKPKPRLRQFPNPEEKLKQELNSGKGFSDSLLVPVDDGFLFDERSEDASEAYSASLSESLSASTANLTEKRVSEAPAAVEKVRRREERPLVAQSASKHQRKRSVSGEFGCRNDRSVAVGRHSRRSSASPARRAGDGPAVGRTNSGREPASAAIRRVSAGARRDPGERSGRRSVSPAAKRVAEARHDYGVGAAGGAQHRGGPTARVNGRASPRRVRADEAAATEGSKTGDPVLGVGDGDGEGIGEGKESLENPLVSLECFIFL